MTFSRSFKLLSCLALASSMLPSCVSPKNVAISSADRAAMRGKTVVVSKREMPGFAVMTPGKAVTAGMTGLVGGAIVGAVAANEGKEALQRHHVAAPENGVSQGLLKQLVSRNGARPASAPTTVKGGNAQEIAGAYPQADYVLDVFTTAWMGSYYPGTFSKYYILHGTKMQLIERSSGRVVAEGFHSYKGEDKERAPDYDGIFANDAAFLKAETKKSTDGATATFSGLL
jgi:hypothetical protein